MDEHLVLAVREVFQVNPNVAQWCAGYLEDHSVPQAIRDVIPQDS